MLEAPWVGQTPEEYWGYDEEDEELEDEEEIEEDEEE